MGGHEYLKTPLFFKYFSGQPSTLYPMPQWESWMLETADLPFKWGGDP
jgi:hypothetical protein